MFKKFAVGALVGISAWISGSTAQASIMDMLRCDGGDYAFNVVMDPRQNNYVILQILSNGAAQTQDLELTKVQENGSNHAEYAGSDFRFVRSDKTFDLFVQDMAISCSFLPEEETADGGSNQTSAQTGQLIDVAGQSLGGKLRAGPGMEHRDIGNLLEGAEIRILNNTGVTMNGYDWFQIELLELGAGHGAVYQWGGIMCSKDELVPGIFKMCGQPASQN